MKRKSVRQSVAGLAVFSLLISAIPINALAASDVTGHWSEKYMSRLVSESVLSGYENGSLLPDREITRAEFVTMINKAFGFVDQDNKLFTDIQPADWFASEIQKAVKEGYITGYEDGSVKPSKSITREEAATTIWRVSKLKKGSPDVLGEFKDAGAIQSYAKEAVASLVKGDVIEGYPNGTFGPTSSITRGEAAAMISRFVDTIFSKADTTYTGEKGRIYGNVVVNKPGITLKDMNIEGNLYITPGVGESDITLEGVNVKGITYVAGGGTNSIHVVNSTLNTMITEKKNEHPVRVELQGDSSIEQAELESSARLETTKLGSNAKGIKLVKVINTITENIEIVLSGNFPNVSLSDDANLQLVTGSIETMDTAKGHNIVVKTMQGTSIKKIVLADTITINDQQVEAGKEVSVSEKGTIIANNGVIPGVPTGGGSSGGSSPGGSTPLSINTGIVAKDTAPNVVSVIDTTVNVQYGTLQHELLSQIKSADASPQSYKLMSRGVELTTGMIPAGTTLVVTAQNGIATKTYDVQLGAQVAITGVIMNAALTITKGQTVALDATVTPAIGTNKAVKWSTTDNTVINLVNNQVTGAKPGTATVTVTTAAGQKATSVVTVTDAPVVVSSVALDKDMITLFPNEKYYLGAKALPKFADNTALTWSSSASGVAAVDPTTGLITGIANGVATITATAAGGAFSKATVYVSTELSPKVIFSPVEAKTDTSVLVLWDKSSDQYTTQLDKYVIYKNGVETARTDKMGYTAEGLTANTTYTFEVAAVDKDGKLGPKSAAINVTTKPAATVILDITKAPYNAVGDGTTINSQVIQRALDDAPYNSVVYVPQGTFVTGALFIRKSGVTLKVDGALEAYLPNTSASYTDADVAEFLRHYPIVPSMFEGWEMNCFASLINIGERDSYGTQNLKDITISGSGRIDSNGTTNVGQTGKFLGQAERELAKKIIAKPSLAALPIPSGQDNRSRGKLIIAFNVQNLYIKDVTLEAGASWTNHIVFSDHVTFNHNNITSMYETSPGVWAGVSNGDGIDPDASTNMNIFDIYFRTYDDAVAVKSGRNMEGFLRNKSSENIRVTNSTVDRGRGAFVIGSEMSGGVRNVLFQDIDVIGLQWETVYVKFAPSRGGFIENIVSRDLYTKDCVQVDALIRVSNYAGNSDGDAAPVLPTVQKLSFENIVTENITYGPVIEIVGMYVPGKPASPVKDLIFRNSRLESGMYAYNSNTRGTFLNGYAPFIAPAIIDYAENIAIENVSLTAKNNIINGDSIKYGDGTVVAKPWVVGASTTNVTGIPLNKLTLLTPVAFDLAALTVSSGGIFTNVKAEPEKIVNIQAAASTNFNITKMAGQTISVTGVTYGITVTPGIGTSNPGVSVNTAVYYAINTSALTSTGFGSFKLTVTEVGRANPITYIVNVTKAKQTMSSVRITGTPTVGQTLTAQPLDAGSAMIPAGVNTMKWYSSVDQVTWTQIFDYAPGMADPLYSPDMTYTVKSTDIGKYIKAEVTGDDKVMSKGPLSSTTTTPVQP